jgi:3-oxoadipate enol-lactonase
MNILMNGLQISYTDAGQGTPLLFVHGFPLNRQMWQPQVDGLSGAARIIAPDLRGHGDSQTVPGPYSMDLFAGDLNALLDALGITQKIVLCGLSMGGYVAFAFYRKYAHRLAGLVLTATRAAADSPEARAGRDQTAALVREKGVEALVEGMVPRLLAPQTLQTRPDLVEQARTIIRRTSLEGALGDLAALKERPDSTPTLAQIDLPVLLLPGTEDQIVPLYEAQSMHAAIRGARLAVMPNAGHLPNLENPLAFNQAVQDFLATIAASQSAS